MTQAVTESSFEAQLRLLPHVHRHLIDVSPHELGRGEFSIVYRGQMHTLQRKVGVAVKTVQPKCSERERKKFLEEATLISKLNHPNIIRLLGVCVDEEGQPLLILELMERGSLLSYLRASRGSETGAKPTSFTDIVRMMCDVASACEYLERHCACIHSDIAARNCLVDSAGNVKLSDFGQAHDVREKGYYKLLGEGRLPVRWLGPETIHGLVFTSKTDVWSFGVLLWEIVTFGEVPFEGLGTEAVMSIVGSGGLLSIPGHCPRKLRKIISSCWRFEPSARPTFSALHAHLLELLSQDTKPDASQAGNTMKKSVYPPTAALSEKQASIVERYDPEKDVIEYVMPICTVPELRAVAAVEKKLWAIGALHNKRKKVIIGSFTVVGIIAISFLIATVILQPFGHGNPITPKATSTPPVSSSSTAMTFTSISTSSSSLHTTQTESSPPDPQLFVIGGREFPQLVQVYNFVTKKWSSAESLPSPGGYALAAASANNVLYAMGGFHELGFPHSQSTVFAYSAGSWSPAKSMTTRRAFINAATINECIYVVGGLNDFLGYPGGYLSSVEVWNVSKASSHWTTVKSMSSPRKSAGVDQISGKLYAVGGFDSDGRPVSHVERYDPQKNEWEKLPPMSTGRDIPAVAAVGGKLYAIGGYAPPEGMFGTAEVYDPKLNYWTPIANVSSPPALRDGAKAIAFCGRILFVGGKEKRVEIYDPATDHWSFLANSMPVAQAYAGVALIGAEGYACEF